MKDDGFILFLGIIILSISIGYIFDIVHGFLFLGSMLTLIGLFNHNLGK